MQDLPLRCRHEALSDDASHAHNDPEESQEECQDCSGHACHVEDLSKSVGADSSLGRTESGMCVK